MTTDYSTARYYALSGLGYGKGFTPEEAVANYVAAQLSNYRAADTVFKTRPKFKAALETGELAPQVWLAPEGTTGFRAGSGYLYWTTGQDGRGVSATDDQLVTS